MQVELSRLTADSVALVGVPSDENSSFMRGPALAPGRIREALHCGAANLTTERGVDLGTNGRWHDVGDMELGTGEAAFDDITAQMGILLAQGGKVLTLGGDHAITYPIIHAYAARYPRLTIVQFDAHPDLYDELDGNGRSHACPFARIMENGLAQRLVQIGIRTMNAHQRAQAERFGVEVIEAWQVGWETAVSLAFDTPVYLSLDMDVLDPAFAPGVSHHEPGGLTTRQLFHLIQNLSADLVGADVVELNPHRDLVGMTAMVAAKCTKELLARLLG